MIKNNESVDVDINMFEQKNALISFDLYLDFCYFNGFLCFFIFFYVIYLFYFYFSVLNIPLSYRVFELSLTPLSTFSFERISLFFFKSWNGLFFSAPIRQKIYLKDFLSYQPYSLFFFRKWLQYYFNSRGNDDTILDSFNIDDYYQDYLLKKILQYKDYKVMVKKRLLDEVESIHLAIFNFFFNDFFAEYEMKKLLPYQQNDFIKLYGKVSPKFYHFFYYSYLYDKKIFFIVNNKKLKEFYKNLQGQLLYSQLLHRLYNMPMFKSFVHELEQVEFQYQFHTTYSEQLQFYWKYFSQKKRYTWQKKFPPRSQVYSRFLRVMWDSFFFLYSVRFVFLFIFSSLKKKKINIFFCQFFQKIKTYSFFLNYLFWDTIYIIFYKFWSNLLFFLRLFIK